MCSTTQSTVETMTRMISLGVAETVQVRMVVLQRSAYRIFKSASFSEQVLPVSSFLPLPFLTRFPHTRCHIQGIFQNYSQLLDISTPLVLKTAEELIVPSVYLEN